MSADKLDLVDVVMMLSDLGCEGSRTQSVEYQADEAAAAPAPVRISVTERVEGPADACAGEAAFEPGETVYAVDYRWDEAAERYVAEGAGWAALDEVNGARY